MFTLGNYTNIIDHARDPNCNRVPVLGNILDHDIDPYYNMVPFLGGIPDHDRVSDPEMTSLKNNTRRKQPSNLSSLDSLLTTAEAKVNPLLPVMGPEINYR